MPAAKNITMPGMTPVEQGRRILGLRKAYGWNNRKLSAQTGIPEGILSTYTTGKVVSIHPRDIVRLAIALGVTCDYLLYGNRMHLAAMVPPAIFRALPPEGPLPEASVPEPRQAAPR